MNSKTLDLGGPVHVADWGGHGEPLVLVHGLGGSHLNWAAVAPELAKRFKVSAIDLLGFGYTPLAGRTSSLKENTELVRRYIAEHLGGAAHVAGNSMGGMVALRLAAEHPEAVRSLVLASPAVPRDLLGKMDPRLLAIFGLTLLPGVGPRLVAWQRNRKSPEEYVAETMELCCRDPSKIPPDIQQLHLEFARGRDQRPWAVDAFVQGARAVVFRLLRRGLHDADIKRIQAPALLFGGAHDVLVPIASTDRLAKLRPDWRYLRLDHLAHVPMLEEPQFFVDQVLGWYDEQAREVRAVAVQRT